jgi:PAS domain S-box-containing protein
MSEVARSFGRRLSSLRKMEGLTQARLAALLEVTPEYVSNLERGSSTPSFELLGRLAGVLRTEIANLFLFGPEATDPTSPDWTRYLTAAGSWIYDVVTDDLWWSQSIYRLLGLRYKEDMPTTERYRDFVHPDDINRVEAEWHQLLETGKPSLSEGRLVRADGTVRNVISYIETEVDEAGKPRRAIGEVVDITDQKRLERSLRTRHQALEERIREQADGLDRTVLQLRTLVQEKDTMLRRLDESESRFRSLVENMNEVFWINDRTTNKLFYMSPSFERVFGTSVEVLRNDVRNFVSLVHPEDRESAIAAFYRAREQGGEYEDYYRILRPDGETRWIHSRGRAFADNPRLFAGMAEDVTELKRPNGPAFFQLPPRRSRTSEGSM